MDTNKEYNGYEIKFKGHLDTYWSAWFKDWSITNLENGEVLLKNSSVDQSGLHGALNKIRDLNLKLISVSSNDPTTHCSDKENKEKT
jgi:hypothetical protein